eukprot:CAMPEP_0206477964 /NCGR_PEP_ID=MMETSP0324_2-20121206/35760_1 /ASSEMBLY_ACC=CAM_ASM_000836 /TAXON_ID=2866 /ORGANISM="Crypthecodinium cohnii, Strain Seligo" /LENGTH=178 /DNA_ID=CAMNT_0053954157 /DNA_START=88 /DNA_END=621 /DNA_ORIENTATION=+
MAGVSTALNEMTSVGWSNLVLIVVMLAAGSVNTINTKFQLQTCAPVSNEYQDLTECPEGGEKKYDKTWLNVLFMFIGETSMFAVYLISEWQKRRAEEAKAAKAHALEEEDQQIKVSFDLEDSADSTQEAKAEDSATSSRWVSPMLDEVHERRDLADVEKQHHHLQRRLDGLFPGKEAR